MQRISYATGLLLTFTLVALMLIPANTVAASPGTPVAPSAVAIDFDPLACTGHWSNLDAFAYLDLDKNDTAQCPVKGMFTAANGYFPVWASAPRVEDEFGKVLVRQDGDCSPPAPDTGPNFDFELPCKAHDYCYDLRKASFSGTVSDFDCDHWFFQLMVADCTGRAFVAEQACLLIAGQYGQGVSLPWVVTNPNPGVVEIRSRATGKCADIEGPSWSNNAPIQQWSCVGVNNQRFKIWPAPNAPGYFQLRPQHSNMCARTLTEPVQWACQNWNSQRFKIQGALNQDQYSIRSKTDTSECWAVPWNNWNNGTDLINPPCNDYSNWYIWRIHDV